MKALIIYDDATFALRANFLLRNAAHGANSKNDLDVNLWRSNMLRFQSVAREALAEALDVDLIVFAGPQVSLLPRWLKGWLEEWAARRQVQDAALALIEDQALTTGRTSIAAELCEFARQHELGFVASRESQKIEATPLPFETSGYPRDRRSTPDAMCAVA